MLTFTRHKRQRYCGDSRLSVCFVQSHYVVEVVAFVAACIVSKIYHVFVSIKCRRTAWKQIPNRFGILSSVFGVFRYSKYWRPYRYRYFKISDISSFFRYTDPRL